MQKDFCLFLLDIVPSLREYGNIAYHESHPSPDHEVPETTNLSAPATRTKYIKNRSPKTCANLPVVPIITIDAPD